MTESFVTLAADISALFANRAALAHPESVAKVQRAIAALDAGQIRVVDPATGAVNTWVKQAILLYFAVQKMEVCEAGPFEYHDKIPLKTHATLAGVRCVPGAVIRKGSFVEPGAILMPSFVNIGA